MHTETSIMRFKCSIFEDFYGAKLRILFQKTIFFPKKKTQKLCFWLKNVQIRFEKRIINDFQTFFNVI